MPLSFDPGEAYQFDWSHEYAVLSGTMTRVKAAHMRLCYSRMQPVQIFPRESQEMVFEAHERAFRFFGGVCRRGRGPNRQGSGAFTATLRRPLSTLHDGVAARHARLASGCAFAGRESNPLGNVGRFQIRSSFFPGLRLALVLRPRDI